MSEEQTDNNMELDGSNVTVENDNSSRYTSEARGAVERADNVSDINISNEDDDENYHSLPSAVADSYMRSQVGSSGSSSNGKLTQSILLLGVFGLFSVLASFLVLSRYPILPRMTIDSMNERYMELTRDSKERNVHIAQREKMDSDPSLLMEGPSIVWLFAYPQSGAVQFLHMIHVVSKKATATNYGHMVMDPLGVVHQSNKDSVRVYDHNPHPGGRNQGGDHENAPIGSGPALFSHNRLPPPDKHILTWTATDGACRDCHPRKYMYNYRRFRDFCWHGTVQYNQQQVPFQYDAQRVVATVHLSRNPFDNVILRFWAEREDKAAHGHETFVQTYPPTPEGFVKWCHHMDSNWFDVEKAWYGKEVMELATGGDNGSVDSAVICRQEFYKYVMFHNNAVRMREGARLPNMNLKYEDLDTGYFRTIGKLISFLELPVVDSAPDKDLQVGFSKPYFTDQQREQIFRFMQHLALPKVKDILTEYQNMQL